MSNELFRASSRREWIGNQTVEHINAGSFQRIADATEKMVMSHTRLVEEKESARRMEKHWRNLYDKAVRRASALRGVITKLKKASRK